ncbi:histidine kinase dimerization/phosphoacceptor domain -containing protein [Methylobacterium sp. GC_Met_2]|uniref:sensor histidine kinase n=1 Tax=Methylobacterium sp. GC_Met_2 TaxID=2937376 RepID=UPI00226B2B18|nr:histidine kinase dimerization/phosphoacceptor domain -containing protein [Methylobacterium sp. GC_Met_2]
MTDQANDAQETLLTQQRVLAKFGGLAMRSLDLTEILTEACRLVGEALHTDLAKVMELQPDGKTLLVRAGVGWKPGVVGEATVKAEIGSSEGHALRTGKPVTSDDIENEDRFTCAAFLRDNGVHALVNVIIIGAEGKPPYGLLEVDSRTARRFTEEDIAFLETYANLLAAAVDRLRMLDDLRAAVRDKERLLQELQHRVKNNLQVITAFVSAQSRRTTSPEAKAELEAIGHRIETLRLVHDKLYAAGELERIDLAPYLSELCGTLLKFHGGASTNVHLRTDLEPVHVRPEAAIPLGLIVNEFVTNSLKYAFGGKRGIVGVQLAMAEDGTATLTLWDDGMGFDGKPGGGTGMRLVNGLVGQLGATAKWCGEDGARLVCSLPRETVLVVPAPPAFGP